MGHLSLLLLGSPEVRHAGHVVEFPTRKALALLAYLAVESGLHTREKLAVLFWPESDAERGRAALRRTLAYLREALGEPAGHALHLVVERDALGFAAADSDLDLHTLQAAWTLARGGPHSAAARSAHRHSLVAQLQAAVERYRDDFLDGFFPGAAPDFDEWVSVQREAWHRRVNLVFDRLAQLQFEGGDVIGALETTGRWIAHSPLHEAAHRRRMLALFAGGDRAAALRAYEECRALLAAELQADPAPETATLAARLRVESPPSTDLRLTGAAARWRPAGLPVPLTPLIGRERDVAAVRHILARDAVRLLTLLGPPGIGKTRLGIQVAAELQDDFEDGACFVALAAISDSGLVASAIAQALEIVETRERSPLARLKHYLRDRHMLLVLDNFEQVEAAAPLLTELLAAAPSLKMLVTSRVVLHLYGEYEFAVPPLALPNRLPPSTGTRLALPPLSELARVAALALFAQRAQAVKADFALTDANVQLVAEICARLDGLPLAIELAAAQIKRFTPAALLAQLSNRLALLISGARDLPARQQTLHAAITWSYDLLDTPEQMLFAQLGVFVGGWTVEAARAVYWDLGDQCSPAAAPPTSIRARLHALVDKSLVRREELSRPGETRYPAGEPRFVMLETIREYALERLVSSGELDAVRRRHAQYYLALAEAVAPAFEGSARSEQWATLRRLDVEHDNVRAALAWSRAAEDGAEVGLRLAGALWQFWWIRGYLREGREQLAGVLARVAAEPTVARARALNAAGFLAANQGDYAAARAYHAESLAMSRALEDQRNTADALLGLGNVTWQQNDYARAEGLFAESLALFRELGDIGSSAWALVGLGNAARQQGDYRRAETRLEQGLALFSEIGYQRGSAWTLDGLGELARQRGDYVQAKTLVEESLALQRETGDKRGIATALSTLGCIARCEADYRLAKTCYRESLTLRRELGDKAGIAEVLEGLAGVAGLEGQPRRAAWLFGAAEALRAAIGAPLPPGDRAGYTRMVIAVRDQLDAGAFAAAWAEGSETALV